MEDSILVVSIVQVMRAFACFISIICGMLIISATIGLLKDKQGKHKKDDEVILTWAIIILLGSMFIYFVLPNPEDVIIIAPSPNGPYR